MGAAAEPNEPRPAESDGSLWDQEPLATVRAHPRRFAWGLPVVLLVPIVAAVPFADDSMARAVALQLFLQTAGLLWLYVPAFRRRYVEEAARLPQSTGSTHSTGTTERDDGAGEPAREDSGSRG